MEKKKKTLGTERCENIDTPYKNKIIIVIIITLSQRPLKSFNLPLMKVSLSNSNLVTYFVLEAE